MKSVVGSEKQVSYAAAILCGLEGAYQRVIDEPAARPGEKSRAKEHLPAVRFLLALGAGDIPRAQKVLEDADGYLPDAVMGLHLIAQSDGQGGWRRREPESLEDAVVVADSVIDYYKGDFYRLTKA